MMGTLPLWNSTTESDRKVVEERGCKGFVKGHRPFTFIPNPCRAPLCCIMLPVPFRFFIQNVMPNPTPNFSQIETLDMKSTF